ncbi:MAG: DUF1844 domain-containing protein [Planctomycetota bacterium]
MSDEARRASDVPLPGGNFRLFVTRIAIQAMFSMGVLDHPITGQKEVNLDNARMLIDDLVMLQEKTVGNLDPDEQAHIDKALDDLRRAYEGLAG